MQLPSLIFIDGGDPAETIQADHMLKQAGLPGIGGQTTNPTLVAKNPEIQKYLASGKKLTHEEALAEYKKIILSVARVTSGPISIQVIGDQATGQEELLRQARVYKDWIPNGVVKFPLTGNGLAAAEIFCQEWSVNITLNFSQEQAAAVYMATRKSFDKLRTSSFDSAQAKHRVFISPFVGRLDDRGENGMQVVENETKMYGAGDHHVEILTASLRKLDHLLYGLQLKSPAITLPFKIFEDWANVGFGMPPESYEYDKGTLIDIPYREIPLNQDWRSYNIQHDLTDKGLKKFMEDWNSLIK